MKLAMRLILVAVLICAGCSKAPPEKTTDELLAERARLAKDFPPVSEKTWRGIEAMICEPITYQMCRPDGCETGGSQPIPTWIKWHPQTRTYERCDAQGCDSYENATVAYSGSWANIALPERNAMLRLAGKHQFIEVAGFGEGVFIKRGQCRVER
jgi:hypothetical protein